MIITIKEYKKHLIKEALEDLENSDKNLKLKEYQEDLKYYNLNKEKMKNILITKKPEEWEKEAAKIIKNNSYLGLKWKLDKIQKVLKDYDEKIKSGELTEEERKEITDKIIQNKKDFNEIKNSIAKTIKNDLLIIQKL